MGTAKERERRLREIPEMIRKSGGTTNFIALWKDVAVPWSVTRIKLWEYLATLNDAGVIKIETGREDAPIRLV